MGGLVVELRLDDPLLRATLAARYGPFLTEASSAGLVITQDPGADSPPPTDAAAETAVLGAGADAARVDGLVRSRLPELAAPALVVHGTLLAHGGCTFLCCGVSGAGKSTLAAMLGERALCDELALVRPAAGGFEGVALPYWEARPGAGPLAGVFVLEQAPAHRRHRLDPRRTVRELRRHVCWPTEDPAAMEQALGTLTALAAAVPTWRLEFARDPGVWDVIREAPR